MRMSVIIIRVIQVIIIMLCVEWDVTHSLWGLSGLKMLSHAHFWVVLGILASKVGQTDLVFVVRSEFVNRSVDTRLWYKSLYSGYHFCHSG